jgi:hypothetical protein
MRTIAVFAAVAICTTTPVGLTKTDYLSSVGPEVDASNQILEIAQEYLMDQVNSVTENKDFNRDQGTNHLVWSKVVDPLASILKGEAPRVQASRKMLRGTLSEHDWGKAELRNPKVTLLGNKATLVGDECAELHYKYLPDSYFYALRHTFEFIFADGEWKLSKDSFNDDPAEISPTPYARHGLLATLHDGVSAISPELARPIDPQNVPAIDRFPPRPGIVLPPAADKLLAVPPEPEPGPDPYDGNAAANYAHAWTYNYNPDYPSYQDDCTNFVSQALKAGGWIENSDWHSRWNAVVRATGGQYATGSGLVSRSWSEAEGLWQYGTGPAARFSLYSKVSENHHPHAYNAPGFFVPVIGDLVFADWDHGDGRWMQHVMIITSLSRGGGRDWHTVQVSSHTANEYDATLDEIVVSAKNNDNKDPAILSFFYAHPAG